MVPVSPRLVFREFADADLAALAELLGDPQVMQYSWQGVRDRAGSSDVLREMQQTYREHGFGKWGLWRRETGEFAGYAGLDFYVIDGRREIELGYRLLPRCWGQGLATEAAQAVLRHAFGPLRLPYVTAFTHPPNEGSRRVLTKSGFRLVGPTTLRGQTMLLFRAEAPQ